MEILMDEHNHITQKVTSWSQPHLHPFSQEVISTKLSPADTRSTMSEAQIKYQRSFIAPTPQTDFTTHGYQRTETSTSLNTNLTESACSNYPISIVQELGPNMKHLEWEKKQDVIHVGKDKKPIISSTPCFTVEDPYFGPESPPAYDNPSVMETMVPDICMENPIPSFTLNNEVLELPKHDCNDKGMKTCDF